MLKSSDVTPMRLRQMLAFVSRYEYESGSTVKPGRRRGVRIYSVPTTDITVVE
jgi:hypothetical protein